MEEDFVELIDYSIQWFLAGVLVTILSFVSGLFSVVPVVVAAVIGSVAVMVCMVAFAIFVVDPFLIRTETRVRIEWQWFSEKTFSQTIERRD
jgi:hypothetical protein